MMTFMHWLPFLVVIAGNVGYHIIAKATPAAAPPFLSLSITYLVSFLLCSAAYLLTGPSLRHDIPALNWTCFAWGIALVAIEFGYMLLYRSGWKISMASLTVNITVAILLALIGILFYKDLLLPRQCIGISLCLLGIFFLHS